MRQTFTTPAIARAGWIAGAAFFVLIATTQTFHDPDVWWHLRLGALITGGGLPHTEPFAYAPTVQPWVGQQWLYEVVLARLTAVSPALAAAAFGVAGALAFVIAARAMPRPEPGSGGWAALAIVLCVFGSEQVLGTRGQVITVLGSAISLWVVQRWAEGSTRALWVFPPLMVLWCNLHAGFFTGPVILGVGVLLRPEPGRGARGALLATAAAGSALTLLNPAGLHLWSYVASTFGNGTLTQFINEWTSPDFHNVWLRLLEFDALALVTVWVLAPGGPRPYDVVMAGGTVAAMLWAQRNIALFAIVATPQIATYGAAAWAAHRHRIRIGLRRRPTVTPARGRVVAAAVILPAALLIGAVAGVAPRLTDLADGAYERSTEPAAAATFLLDHHAGERVYSTYELGGYLVYRLPPRSTYVYGESAIFGSNTLQQYLDIHLARSNWVTRFASLHASQAVLPDQGQEVSMLHEIGWIYECHDPAGYIVMGPGDATSSAEPATDPSAAPAC